METYRRHSTNNGSGLPILYPLLLPPVPGNISMGTGSALTHLGLGRSMGLFSIVGGLFFSRVHATLHPALSVRRLVGPSHCFFVPFCSFWVILGQFGSFWVILGRFGSIWVILGHFGHFGLARDLYYKL